jgi:alkanesulfonate monooxygenase SsuD/methylene tetrahydromethanopterin reductase-like flavin-dependent oxidoreductase (luciferase family)
MGYASFEALVDKCAAAEALGFEGFYASDHLHGVAGAPVDTPFLEPFTLLAGLAARTRRLRLGCTVAGVTYRHPSMLAKIVGTLDVISGGRAELGLGASWSREDHLAYGLPFPPLRQRLEQLEEAVEIVCGLWSGERFSFSGRHWQLCDAPFAPRPLQRPRPPLLLAGASPRVLALVARRAQAWLSVSTAAFARRCIGQIEADCARSGRDPREIEYCQSFGLLLSDSPAEVERALAARAAAGGSGTPDTAQARVALADEPPEVRARASLLAGDPDQLRAQLCEYVDAGVTHFILQTPPPFDAKSVERFQREVMVAFAGDRAP